MKKRCALVIAMLGGLACGSPVVYSQGAGVPAATNPGAFRTDAERAGYAIGLQLGKNLGGAEVDGAALAAGIKDAGSGAKPRMTEAEIEAAMMALQKQVMEAKQKQGETYLTENGKREGVKTTASGLQYRVIKTGNGKTPKASDTVSVHYKGTLTNGQEFDASGATPVSFPVNRVIPGWTEALQLMKEGDKWELVIPSKLAYGERGAGGDIPPNSTLVFEVELIAVKPAE